MEVLHRQALLRRVPLKTLMRLARVHKSYREHLHMQESLDKMNLMGVMPNEEVTHLIGFRSFHICLKMSIAR